MNMRLHGQDMLGIGVVLSGELRKKSRACHQEVDGGNRFV